MPNRSIVVQALTGALLRMPPDQRQAGLERIQRQVGPIPEADAVLANLEAGEALRAHQAAWRAGRPLASPPAPDTEG